MADIQTGRFGSYFQALLNLKQRLTLGQALPDILATVNPEDPRPEMECFSGNDLCAATIQVPIAAAELGFAALMLPAGAGRIAVIESILVAGSAAESILIGLASGNIGGAPATTPQLLDPRRALTSARPSAVLRVGSNAATAISDPIATLRHVGNTTVRYDGKIMLVNVAPEDSRLVIVECQTVAQAFQVSFLWRERNLESAERQATI